VVYPVGMTTYWCYFSWKIIYNFVTIYGIAGIMMCPDTVLLCTTFQDYWIMSLHLIETFVVWRKEELSKETWSIFEGSYLRNALKFKLECEVVTLASISTTKKIVCFHQSITELHMRENCIIVLPYGCGMQASWMGITFSHTWCGGPVCYHC